MRPLGDKKCGTAVEGHQNCGICHPEIKGRKAKSKKQNEQEIEEYFDSLLEKMQTEECKKKVQEMFDATPEELGQAAVGAAKKKE